MQVKTRIVSIDNVEVIEILEDGEQECGQDPSKADVSDSVSETCIPPNIVSINNVEVIEILEDGEQKCGEDPSKADETDSDSDFETCVPPTRMETRYNGAIPPKRTNTSSFEESRASNRKKGAKGAKGGKGGKGRASRAPRREYTARRNCHLQTGVRILPQSNISRQYIRTFLDMALSKSVQQWIHQLCEKVEIGACFSADPGGAEGQMQEEKTRVLRGQQKRCAVFLNCSPDAHLKAAEVPDLILQQCQAICDTSDLL